MGRGQTTDEFKTAQGPLWYYAGGLPGDPGIVTDAARRVGDMYDLDAEALDDMAGDHGWEFHDPGYDEKILDLAVHAMMGELSIAKAAPPPGKACAPVPCPSFEDVTLEVTGVCVCHDLAPGQLYVSGCVVHDLAAIEA